MYQHVCKECGKTFESYKKASCFCSNTCKFSYNHKTFMESANKLINKKFGKLTVLDVKIEKQHTKCLCLCDCGNKIWVNASNLKNGHTTSCGCYQKEVALKTNLKYLEKHRKENHIENTNLSKITSSISKNNRSGVKGVYWHSQSKKWVAKLNFKGKSYLKEFVKMEDAIKYRKELEEKYFKPILEKYDKAD